MNQVTLIYPRTHLATWGAMGCVCVVLYLCVVMPLRVGVGVGDRCCVWTSVC